MPYSTPCARYSGLTTLYERQKGRFHIEIASMWRWVKRCRLLFNMYVCECCANLLVDVCVCVLYLPVYSSVTRNTTHYWPGKGMCKVKLIKWMPSFLHFNIFIQRIPNDHQRDKEICTVLWWQKQYRKSTSHPTYKDRQRYRPPKNMPNPLKWYYRPGIRHIMPKTWMQKRRANGKRRGGRWRIGEK